MHFHELIFNSHNIVFGVFSFYTCNSQNAVHYPLLHSFNSSCVFCSPIHIVSIVFALTNSSQFGRRKLLTQSFCELVMEYVTCMCHVPFSSTSCCSFVLQFVWHFITFVFSLSYCEIHSFALLSRKRLLGNCTEKRL